MVGSICGSINLKPPHPTRTDFVVKLSYAVPKAEKCSNPPDKLRSRLTSSAFSNGRRSRALWLMSSDSVTEECSQRAYNLKTREQMLSTYSLYTPASTKKYLLIERHMDAP